MALLPLSKFQVALRHMQDFCVQKVEILESEDED